MKLAICNETYRNTDFPQAFSHARELGYEGIEVAPFTIETNALEITERHCSEIASLAASLDLQIVGLHWLLAFTDGLHVTSPDSATRQRTAEYLAHLARVCRQLGGEVMVLGSPNQRNLLPGVSPNQADDFAIDCLDQVVPELTKQKVVLALEPLGPAEGDFLLTADWAVKLITRLNSPHVRLHLDTKAMSTETKPIPQIIRENSRYLQHFHANDPNLRGPGMGELDFRPILSALREIDYAGWISVEVFDETLAPETLAGESIAYLQKLLS